MSVRCAAAWSRDRGHESASVSRQIDETTVGPFRVRFDPEIAARVMRKAKMLAEDEGRCPANRLVVKKGSNALLDAVGGHAEA